MPQNQLTTFNKEKLTITVHTHRGELVIGKDDVEISFFSGGPGGQNVNKNQNGVRVIYKIPVEFLRPAQKTREIVTRCINQRKREQNIIVAFEQLAEKLGRYFYTPPARKRTRTPRSAKEKRLTSKKLLSQKKQGRQSLKHEL